MKLHNMIAGYAVAAVAAFSTTSCVDTGSVGSSLVQTQSEVVIADEFKIAGRSVEPDSIQSRTILQLLGTIDAGEYGSLRSDFVTQFMPVARLDSVIESIDNIDSCKLLMMFNAGAFVGDSVVPMGLDVFMLNQQLPAPIFSNFDPEGKYDPTPIGSKIYTASNLSANSDSVGRLSYREIYVDLPFSIAERLYNIYKTKPESYLSPDAFAKEFPGIYVRNSYGSGRVTKIGATLIQLFYHYTAKTEEDKDTIINSVGSFYATTPEIITNNNINFTLSQQVRDRVARGEEIIVSPGGYEVEVTFPLLDILKYYHENKGALSVVNSLTMDIPVESLSNTYGINAPNTVLFILKNKKEEFFEQSKITNDLTSFYAKFDVLTGSYVFASLRNYFLDALSREDELTPDDYTFIITPVFVETETSGSNYYYQGSTYVKTITPDIQTPPMCRLMLEDARIQLTFTNQN